VLYREDPPSFRPKSPGDEAEKSVQKDYGVVSILRPLGTTKDESPTLQMMIKQRIQLRDTRYAIRNTNKKGAALLVVLFVIMAITILSLGFLSRSDVELACGQNMILRTQMDYLAESGLQHAKGLILNPQDLTGEYWLGESNLQLVDGSSDFYDVRIIRDEDEPDDNCNYNIECDAYRKKETETVGRSSLKAVLRLDPCIALSVGQSTTLWDTVTVYGDVNCVGTLTSQGTIYGDVFGVYGDESTGTITGQRYAIDKLSLGWPAINVDDFKDRFDVVDYHLGEYTLNGSSINRMLLIEGDLIVSGTNNEINPGKNLPALYVTGDLIIKEGASLNIEGLAVIAGSVSLKDNANLIVLGGLFIRETLSGSNSSVTITADLTKTAIITWNEEGTQQNWGQAAGAFFRSIERK